MTKEFQDFLKDFVNKMEELKGQEEKIESEKTLVGKLDRELDKKNLEFSKLVQETQEINNQMFNIYIQTKRGLVTLREYETALEETQNKLIEIDQKCTTLSDIIEKMTKKRQQTLINIKKLNNQVKPLQTNIMNVVTKLEERKTFINDALSQIDTKSFQNNKIGVVQKGIYQYINNTNQLKKELSNINDALATYQEKYVIASNKPSVAINWEKVSKLSLEEKVKYFDNLGTLVIDNAKNNPVNLVEIKIGNVTCQVNKADKEVFLTSLEEFKKAEQELVIQNQNKPFVTINWNKVNRLSLAEKVNYFDTLGTLIVDNTKNNPINPVEIKIGNVTCQVNKADKEVFLTSLEEFKKAQKLLQEEQNEEIEDEFAIEEKTFTISKIKKITAKVPVTKLKSQIFKIIPKLQNSLDITYLKIKKVEVSKTLNNLKNQVLATSTRLIKSGYKKFLTNLKASKYYIALYNKVAEKLPSSLEIDWIKVYYLNAEQKADYFMGLLQEIKNQPQIMPKTVVVGDITDTINAYDEELFVTCCQEFQKAKQQYLEELRKKPSFTVDWAAVKSLYIKDKIEYFNKLIVAFIEIAKVAPKNPQKVTFGKKTVLINALDVEEFIICCQEYSVLKRTNDDICQQMSTKQILDWNNLSQIPLEERISYFELILEDILSQKLTDETALVRYKRSNVVINERDRVRFERVYKAYTTAKLMLNAEHTMAERKDSIDQFMAEDNYSVPTTFAERLKEAKQELCIDILEAICDKEIRPNCDCEIIHETGTYCFDKKYQKLVDKILSIYTEIEKGEKISLPHNKKPVVAFAAALAAFVVSMSSSFGNSMGQTGDIRTLRYLNINSYATTYSVDSDKEDVTSAVVNEVVGANNDVIAQEITAEPSKNVEEVSEIAPVEHPSIITLAKTEITEIKNHLEEIATEIATQAALDQTIDGDAKETVVKEEFKVLDPKKEENTKVIEQEDSKEENPEQSTIELAMKEESKEEEITEGKTETQEEMSTEEDSKEETQEEQTGEGTSEQESEEENPEQSTTELEEKEESKTEESSEEKTETEESKKQEESEKETETITEEKTTEGSSKTEDTKIEEESETQEETSEEEVTEEKTNQDITKNLSNTDSEVIDKFNQLNLISPTSQELEDLRASVDNNKILAGYHLTAGNTTYNPSKAEIKAMLYVVSHEAQSGSYESAVQVFSTILNRYENGRFQNSFYAIVSAPYQFVVWNESAASNLQISQVRPEVISAFVDVVYRGIRNNDSLYFKAAYTSDYTETGEKKYQIGDRGNKIHGVAAHVDRIDTPQIILAKNDISLRY